MFMSDRNINVVENYNQYNCSSTAFTAQERMLIIFPARMQQVVETLTTKPTDNLIDRRISLAGDFILTFKESTARSMGLQPISNWRQFNV
jgi:hypothetical protein